MNPINHEIFDMIREDVEDGYLLENKEALTYHPELKAWSMVYDVEWFTDEEPEDDEESVYHTFPIALYIFEDKSYKIQFDPVLFKLYYKGDESEEQHTAYQEFMNLALKKGVTLETE